MLCIDGHNIEMEIDTGSAVTLISSNTLREFSSAKELEKTKAQLRTYTGEDVKVLGATTVLVKHHDKLIQLTTACHRRTRTRSPLTRLA